MSHFKLPEWRELSRDEQIPIVNLRTDKTYFVRGGPGTGKSVLAIHRVAKLRDVEPNTKVKLLVYNKALQLHLSDSLRAAGLESRTTQTCHQWIWAQTGMTRGGGLWDYNWAEVQRAVEQKAGGKKSIDHLIIDEAQDVPEPLLRILHSQSRNATIFVDDKQAISEDARKYGLRQLTEVRAIFEAGTGCTFDLTKNFRNSQPILNAALSLNPLPEGDVPDKAIRQEGPKPVLRRATVEEVVRRIETYHANNPADQIAVAVPKAWDRGIFSRLSDSEVPTQLYSNPNARSGRYKAETKGATVLSHEVMKGLEFDAVFMPFLDAPRLHRLGSPDHLETARNLIYVVCTRARSYLELSHERDLPESWLTTALERGCSAGHIRRASE